MRNEILSSILHVILWTEEYLEVQTLQEAKDQIVHCCLRVGPTVRLRSLDNDKGSGEKFGWDIH